LRKEQEAALYVNVVDEESPDTSRIVTGKTSYSFHPRSNPVPITARVIGTNMNDSENDHIWWELRNLDGSEEPVVDIYPAQAMNKEHGSREIQISPRREGEAQIVIGHRYIDPKYYKTISILVSEVSNALTLDKSLVELKLGHTEMLKAAILGAKAKDYEDIQWLVDTDLMFDGSRKEVVRVMGDGQNVMLYPMADGTVKVTARYKGLFAVCMVKVESVSMFSVQARSVRLYPGGVADIGFDVRPIDSFILWYSSDYGSSDPIIRYEELLGQKILRITGLREGSAQIQGISNGKHAAINVTVNYDYKVLADAYVEFTPVTSHTDKPTVIHYSVYPPNTRIKAEIPGNIINDVTVEIMNPVYKSDQDIAEGIIYITANREVNQTDITWRQIKPDEKSTEKFAKTRISVNFEPREKIIPYFVRGTGVWTNAITTGSGSNQTAKPRAAYIGYNKQVLGEVLNGSGDNYSLEIGDGENHYIAFDRMYQNSFLEISVDATSAVNLPADTLQAVDIVHNGNITKAIRISGGADKIQYDRVAFKKRLFVDVKTKWGEGTGGGDISQITPAWHDDVTVQYQTGWDTKYYPLWNKYEDYIYEIRDVYLYSAAQVNRIKAYLPSAAFSKLTDFQNIRIGEMPPGYDYASNQPEYTFIDNAGYEGAEAGFFYKLFFYKKGYYYSAGTIATYPQLFSNVTFENALNVVNTDRVSLVSVKRTEQEPKYDNKTVYAYYINENSDCYNANGAHVKFVSINNDSLLSNYGNVEYVNNQLKIIYDIVYVNEKGNEGIEYYRNSYSFNKYYFEDIVLTQSDSEEVSTWDVFNADNANKWTRGWKILPYYYYDWSENSGSSHWYGDCRALQFYYSGIKRGKAYVKGSMGMGMKIAPYSSGYEVDEVNFYGSTGGNNAVVAGNKSQINIFGGTADEPKKGEYGSFYVQQLRIYSWNDGRNTHGSYTNYDTDKYNGLTGAQQRYYWSDNNDPVIVPISRMTKFPFFIQDISAISTGYTGRYANNFPKIATEKPYGFVVDFKTGPGSTPMPSINTTSDNLNGVRVYIRYRLFGDTVDKTITFTIYYRTRNCHHLYDGALVNGSVNNNEQLEPQGEVNWDNLVSLNDNLADDKKSNAYRFIYEQKKK